VVGAVAVSCATLALFAAINAVTLRQANEIGTRLEARFGSLDTFVPSPDGRIPEDRMRAFLVVRRELTVPCADLREIPDNLAAIVSRAAEPGRSVSSRFKSASQDFEHAMQLGWYVGVFFKVRDQTLWMRRMGLAEYSYIYVLAYKDQLQTVPARDGRFSGTSIEARPRELLITLMERQHTCAQESAETSDFAAALAEEILTLRADDTRIPWQDGCPDPLRESIEPFRNELDAAFCEASTTLELRHHQGRAGSPFGE